MLGVPGPIFYLQIVDRNHEPVSDPFMAGPIELDLIESAVQDILARGVGVFRTSAHVEDDIRAGLIATFQRLKDRTIPIALRA